MKILFVCKHNRFRSKFAEALFNKYNKNKKYVADSAGLIRGRYPLDKVQAEIGRKRGIILKGRPKGLSSELLFLQDKVIIVANDVPASIFIGRKNKNKSVLKVEVWKIPDTRSDNEKEINSIIDKIEKKVIELVRENG